MRVSNSGKKPLTCDGPAPYEALQYNNGSGGTLADGTTYTFSTTPGATVIDLGQGTIEWGSSNDILTINFSAPVDFGLFPAVANTGRTVWHTSGNQKTEAISDGSAWCLVEGSQPIAGIVVNGQTITGTGTGADANVQWGSATSYGVNTVAIQAYVWDAFNMEARPKTKVEQPVCDVLDDVCNQLKAAQYVAPAALTAAKECSGPFEIGNSESSWWQGWTPVITANQGTSEFLPWRTVGNGIITSPDCITDLKWDADLGSHYLRVRRARAYVWLSYRLLVNGTPVYTRTNRKYRYLDERDEQSDTGGAPSVPSEIELWGGWTGFRLNIPASSTVELQVRGTWNINGMQSNGYVRYIGGLRSITTFSFSPKTIITEVS